MPLFKQKIFLIPFKQDGNDLDWENEIHKKIESFLNDDNVVYLDHTISVAPSYKTDTFQQNIAGRPSSTYSSTISKFVVVSIIYKDLSSTVTDVNKLSQKAKKQLKEITKIGVKKIKMPEELKD